MSAKLTKTCSFKRLTKEDTQLSTIVSFIKP